MSACSLEAHRGVSTEYPENTLCALRAAARQGYGMVEVDPRFTADGHCVLLHDPTLNRTARNADGTPLSQPTPLDSLSLAQARELDLGMAFDPAFAGEKIPTLEEVLSFALEARMPVKFDNVLQKYAAAQQETFFQTVERMGALPFVGFTANSPEFAARVLTRLPGAQIHYDGPASQEILRQLSALVPAGQLTIWLRFDNATTAWHPTAPVNPESARAVHQIGRLGVWILHTQEERDAAIRLYQADLIETDGSLKP